MKRIYFISAVLMLASCMSYNQMFTVIPEQYASEIPLKASKVTVTNTRSLNENFTLAYKTLLNQNYKIESDNKEMGYILASKMDAGDTHVRLNVNCSDGSVVITSEWKPGNTSTAWASAMSGMTVNYDEWDNALWYKRADKPSIAFAKAVMLAKELGGQITYYPDSSPQKKLQPSGDPAYL